MHVHCTIVHRRGNDTRVQSRQLKCFYICCGTLQYSQCEHKENPRGTQGRSSSLGKLEGEFVGAECGWDEVKSGEIQYEDFFKYNIIKLFRERQFFH